ncbi:MAG: APC family permease [Acidobacteria bacterium]|nr:MAG: APC family permease [Acidobacteriota bacterium]
MRSEPQPSLVRGIGRWSLVALVLNSIIGSGVFGLPSLIAGLVGGAAPLAYVAAAAGMGVIMACFAEVASRFRAAGGPYLYAHAAFGRFAGIEIAWLTWLARLTAAAGNANLFVIYLAEFWPRASNLAPRLVVLTLLVGFLAAVNYRGVRAGAHLSDFFAAAKLLPLAAFVAKGVFFVDWRNLVASSPADGGTWLQAILLLVFAFGGFEGALIPMSEAKDPRRDAPFALFVALAATTLVYTLAQVVVSGVLAAPERSDRPLAVAARQFLGPPGAALIAAGALVSVYGLLSSMALYTPRLTFALAERGDFPPLFAAIHSRYRTPHFSILIYSLLVWALAASGSFHWNVTLSAAARLFTYAATCAALVRLRRQKPAEAVFRLPAGDLLALLGIAFSFTLVSRMGRGDLAIIAVTIVIALVNWLWARSGVRGQGPGVGGKEEG